MLSEAKLKDLARKLTGREDSVEALEETLRGYIEQKIDHYRQQIAQLEGKYGLKFEAFSEKLGNDLPLSWQHEQDFMAWEEALTNLEYLESASQQLKIHA